VHLQLRELDYRDAWVARMTRIATAHLMNYAMYDIKQLADERSSALAAAQRRPDGLTDQLERGRAMLAQIARGKVMVS
jgi:hypothetical protein